MGQSSEAAAGIKQFIVDEMFEIAQLRVNYRYQALEHLHVAAHENAVACGCIVCRWRTVRLSWELL